MQRMTGHLLPTRLIFCLQTFFSDGWRCLQAPSICLWSFGLPKRSNMNRMLGTTQIKARLCQHTICMQQSTKYGWEIHHGSVLRCLLKKRALKKRIHPPGRQQNIKFGSTMSTVSSQTCSTIQTSRISLTIAHLSIWTHEGNANGQTSCLVIMPGGKV